MGIYLTSGEGRCPSPSYYTETISFSREKLNEYYKLVKGQDDCASAVVLGALSEVLSDPIKALLGNIPIFESIADSVIGDYVESWITSTSSDLDEILRENAGLKLKVKCKVRCVDKGLNGHYWAIYSFKKA